MNINLLGLLVRHPQTTIFIYLNYGEMHNHKEWMLSLNIFRSSCKLIKFLSLMMKNKLGHWQSMHLMEGNMGMKSRITLIQYK